MLLRLAHNKNISGTYQCEVISHNKSIRTMTKITKVSKEGRVANYLIYILADMMETLIPFAEREAIRA